MEPDDTGDGVGAAGQVAYDVNNVAHHHALASQSAGADARYVGAGRADSAGGVGGVAGRIGE